MSQVIGTTISVGSHTERDEFDQEFLWSEEGSNVSFMKCHVQKSFQSDVYDNCKPVPVWICTTQQFSKISKECLSKKTETHFQQYSKKCNHLMNDSCFKAKREFDKAKQESVKFPVQSNYFYEYQKTVQYNPSPVRKSLGGIFMEPLQNC